MLKTIVLAVSLVATNAHAFMGIKPLESAPTENMATTTQPVRDINCAYFSGTWKGTCSDGSSLEAFTLMQMGCTTLILNGEVYPIGGLRSVTVADKSGNASTTSTTAVWDGAQKQLEIKMSTVGGGAMPYEVKTTSRLSTENSKLKVKTDSAAVILGEPVTVSNECTFERQ